MSLDLLSMRIMIDTIGCFTYKTITGGKVYAPMEFAIINALKLSLTPE